MKSDAIVPGLDVKLKRLFNHFMYKTMVKDTLTHIWKKWLPLDTVDLQANFFELGGDALLFEGLLQDIQEVFKINIHFLKSKRQGVFYWQKKFISSALKESPPKLGVVLQRAIKKTNLPLVVAIHPVGGSLFPFMRLIKKIKTQNEIYGIQDIALSGSMYKFHSIEEQARLYIEELIRNTTDREIILMGYSSGGVVAYEMAHQLIKEKSASIQQVVLFDSWVRTPSSIHFRNSIPEMIKRNFDKLRPHTFFQTQEEIDYWLNEIIWNRMQAVFLYKPKSTAVATTLFVPKETVPEYVVEKDMVEGWSQLVSHLNIYSVSGNHENMLDQSNLDPIVKVLKPIFMSRKLVKNE